MDNQITNPKTTEVLNCAKVLLESNNPQGARALLDTIPENERTGEWYYLLGKTESVPLQTPTVNANVNLSFAKKQKETKPKKPKKQLSQKEQDKIGKAIAIPICVIFAILMIVPIIYFASIAPPSGSSGYISDEKKAEISEMGKAQIEAYKSQHQKTCYRFTYYDLTAVNLNYAINAARRYGHNIDDDVADFILSPEPIRLMFFYDTEEYSSHRSCGLFYSALQIDKLNQLIFGELWNSNVSLASLKNGIHTINEVLFYIEKIKVLSEFYPDTSLKFVLAQEDELRVTLEWAKYTMAAYYPQDYYSLYN